MINTVIKFYDTRISAYSLVFKHMRFTYYSFLIVGFSLILSIFPAIFIEHPLSKIIFFVLVLLFLFFYVLLNFQAKKIVRRQLKIDQRDFSWGGEEYHNKKASLLKIFLDQNEINSKKKIEELLKLLSKEAENRKFTGYFIPGIFLAFTIPVWNHFVGSFFKNIEDVNLAIAYAMFLVFFILLFVVGYSMAKTVFGDIVNRQSRKIKEIEALVEIIYFKYVLEDNNDT
ncbi:hypothetical protein P4V43_25575 [Brevibacillus fortis]|uniref:hypothetical protein n=1 Tax=Brevibacillus fortis TaxID=2126352 RepID=UPI002E1E14E1|nr:hypothetical protein [Brevibacillus fortis]